MTPATEHCEVQKVQPPNFLAAPVWVRELYIHDLVEAKPIAPGGEDHTP